VLVKLFYFYLSYKQSAYMNALLVGILVFGHFCLMDAVDGPSTALGTQGSVGCCLERCEAHRLPVAVCTVVGHNPHGGSSGV
tara:strand:- start:703 stop:948 length:246 start_codon:yes stop_codon:yes gene_type:complete